MGKTVNLLTAAVNDTVANDNRLWSCADPVSGISAKLTSQQVKQVFGTQRYRYAASGSEGTTLTISDLAGRYVLAIYREGSILYDVTVSPDSVEYIWDGTVITFGLALNPGERLLILYRYA